MAVRSYQHRNLPSGPAPLLKAVALDGREVSLQGYRGRPVLLHFWATWCAVCSTEQPNITALGQRLPVLTVASQSGDAAAVGAYARQHGITATVVPDPTGALAQRFGVAAFPTTFILDAAGNIRYAEVGYTSELGLRLRMFFAGLHLG